MKPSDVAAAGSPIKPGASKRQSGSHQMNGPYLHHHLNPERMPARNKGCSWSSEETFIS